MLKKKLELLKESNVISNQVYECVIEIMDKIIVENDYDKNKYEMFILHMAMALSRVFNGDDNINMDDCIWNDIKNSEYFEKTDELYKKICKKISRSFPEGEKKYIYLHLNNLMNK